MSRVIFGEGECFFEKLLRGRVKIIGNDMAMSLNLLDISSIQRSKIQPVDDHDVFQAQVLKYVLFGFDRVWDLFLSDP
jgi:hypothetical protein